MENGWCLLASTFIPSPISHDSQETSVF